MNVRELSLGGYRKAYPNIKRGFRFLRRNIVTEYEVTGDCCWELYEKKKFGGQKQVVFPGANQNYPDFKPVSLKKLGCPTP